MNSLLFHTENERLEPGSFYPCDIPAIVRVVVSVPEVEAAEIFVMAQKNDAGAAPLKVMLNGRRCELDTDVVGRVQWLRCQDIGAHVCIDANDLTALPQPGWDLAMEPASCCPLIHLRVQTDATLGRQRLPSYGDPAKVFPASTRNWKRITATIVSPAKPTACTVSGVGTTGSTVRNWRRRLTARHSTPKPISSGAPAPTPGKNSACSRSCACPDNPTAPPRCGQGSCEIPIQILDHREQSGTFL